MNLKNKALYYSLFLLLFLNSCSKKTDLIEIYLLKNRIETVEGIPISKLKNKNITDTFSKSIIEETNYDTVKKEFIYAGKFDVKNKSEILNPPFIENSEIKVLDTAKGTIQFSEEGIMKINNLEPNMLHGIQFVICKNKEPLLTGYFWSKYSSYISTWNCIEFDHLNKKKPLNQRLKFYKGNGMIQHDYKTKIDFLKYKELINSFKDSNRLIE